MQKMPLDIKEFTTTGIGRPKKAIAYIMGASKFEGPTMVPVYVPMAPRMRHALCVFSEPNIP